MANPLSTLDSSFVSSVAQKLPMDSTASKSVDKVEMAGILNESPDYVTAVREQDIDTLQAPVLQSPSGMSAREHFEDATVLNLQIAQILVKMSMDEKKTARESAWQDGVKLDYKAKMKTADRIESQAVFQLVGSVISNSMKAAGGVFTIGYAKGKLGGKSSSKSKEVSKPEDTASPDLKRSSSQQNLANNKTNNQADADNPNPSAARNANSASDAKNAAEVENANSLYKLPIVGGAIGTIFSSFGDAAKSGFDYKVALDQMEIKILEAQQTLYSHVSSDEREMMGSMDGLLGKSLQNISGTMESLDTNLKQLAGRTV